MFRRIPDPRLIGCTLGLLGLGLLMQYSIGLTPTGEYRSLFAKQVLWALFGLLAMTLLTLVPNPRLRPWFRVLLPAALAALLLVLVPAIGKSVGGATSRFRLGQLNAQPAEFVKLALILYLADSLAARKQWIDRFSHGVLPHLIVLGGIFILLALQPDYGTALVMIVTTFAMLFYARAQLRHLLLTAASAVPLLAFVALNWPHVMKRLQAFFSAGTDLKGANYQVHQSLIALGSGGWTGRGLGQGGQKGVLLPASPTDFIFSVIGEELGLLATLATLALFLGILWRGLKIAELAQQPFGRLAAFGCTICLVLQAAINIAVAIGVFPNTGITLPLVSYGGSSLLVSLAMVGVVLSVSRYEEAAP